MELLIGLIGALFGGLCTWLAAERQVRQMKDTQKQQNDHFQKQINDQAKQVGLINVQAASTEISTTQTIFIENPDIWPYFHLGEEVQQGKTVQSRRTYYLCRAIARRMISTFAFELLHREPGVEGYNSNWIEPSIKRYYANSPILRRQLIDHIDEYPVTGEQQLRLLVEGIRSLLDDAKRSDVIQNLELDRTQAERLLSEHTAVQSATHANARPSAK